MASCSTSCAGVGAVTALSSKSLTQTVKSVVYRESSSRLRGLPEAKIRLFSFIFSVFPSLAAGRAKAARAALGIAQLLGGHKAAVYTGAMHSCATRSPGWMV